MSDWVGFELPIPGKEVLDKVKDLLEVLTFFLDIIKVILQTIEIFLIDFGNPVKLVLLAILAIINALFDALKQTGLYAYYDVPNPLQDPNFTRFQGGLQGFVERFKGSLFDSKDPFRPQPAAGGTESGFILIVVDAANIYTLIGLIKSLMRFFGKELNFAQYVAPSNVKVFPAGKKPGALGGANIDPILQAAAVFGVDLKGLAIEWSLATTQNPPDPGFTGAIARLGAEFIPQKWLIEKTGREGGPEIATTTVPTTFEDKHGNPIKRKVKVRDEHGDLFRKFEKYYVIDAQSNSATYFLGQLGTFRFIDTDVTKDKTYYYRVRAFSGPLDVSSNNTIEFKDPERIALTGEYVQRWPSNGSENVIMGRPSGVVTGRVPNVPSDFDVIKVVNATFRTAFALGFHLPKDPEATFDSNGSPTGDTSPIQVGRGSLAELGGPLGAVIPAGFANPGSGSITDPVTGQHPDVTYNLLSVKLHSARLTNTIVNSLLENSSMIGSLRALMQGSLPKPINGKGYLGGGATSIQDLVTKFITLPEGFPDTYDPKVYDTYSAAYVDIGTRQNVLAVVSFLKSFTLGGNPPDWIQISILRDIIPWSGQFIYELIARIQALIDAFKSSLDEIAAFIDLLIRKINVLEQFIQFLVDIINFLESLAIGFHILAVPATSGGIPEWINQIDNAGGSPPSSGPGGYSAGIALAYVAPDVGFIAKAFGTIFGGS